MCKQTLFKTLVLFIFFTLLYFPIALIFKLTFTQYNPIVEITTRPKLIQAIIVSLTTSIISTITSVFVATFAAIGLAHFKKFTIKFVHQTTNMPLIFPDIILGVILLLNFSIIFGKGNFGWTSLITAHITFSAAYAFVIIYPKAKRIGKEYSEAAEDLGATPLQTLFRVIIPNLKGSIIAGAAIAFAVSFDDYIISKFTGGLLENISSYLVSSKRISSRLPGIYSITTIMSIVLVVLFIVYRVYKSKKEGNKKYEYNT